MTDESALLATIAANRTPVPADMLADAERALKLSEQATPAPWFAKGEGICCGVYQGAPGNQGAPIDLDDPTWVDASFIAASRELVPLLANHVKALLVRVAELEAGLREALPYVWPEVSEVVAEYSDLDHEDGALRERNQQTRDKSLRLAAMLANPETRT